MVIAQSIVITDQFQSCGNNNIIMMIVGKLVLDTIIIIDRIYLIKV